MQKHAKYYLLEEYESRHTHTVAIIEQPCFLLLYTHSRARLSPLILGVSVYARNIT